MGKSNMWVGHTYGPKQRVGNGTRGEKEGLGRKERCGGEGTPQRKGHLCFYVVYGRGPSYVGMQKQHNSKDHNHNVCV